jgi:hypothetical protein
MEDVHHIDVDGVHASIHSWGETWRVVIIWNEGDDSYSRGLDKERYPTIESAVDWCTNMVNFLNSPENPTSPSVM